MFYGSGEPSRIVGDGTNGKCPIFLLPFEFYTTFLISVVFDPFDLCPTLESTCYYRVNHYVENRQVRLRVSNNMPPLSWWVQLKINSLNSFKQENNNITKWVKFTCLQCSQG